MALTKKAQNVLGSLKSLYARIKRGGSGGVTHLAYTRNKQGMYHHIYKVGKNLVSQDKVIGKVKKGQRFVQAMNGLALVKSTTINPYKKFLKGVKSAKQLPAIAKKVATLKIRQAYKKYVSTPQGRAARNKTQRAWRAKRKS